MTLPDPQSAATLPHQVLEELAIGTDWLGTWWPAAMLVALAAVLVAANALRGRWAGPGRRRRRWPGAVGVGLTLLLASGFGLNTAVGYVPTAAAASLLLTGHRTASRAGMGEVTAEAIGVPADVRMPTSTTWVYTPPGYDPAGTVRYPVVYLVHGTPGQSSDWFTGGDVAHVMDVLIAEHLVRPMIVVAPDVNGVDQDDTECLDSTRGGSQVETFLSVVVVPWIDSHYATVGDWSHRVIGGMSAGAFCALDQGLRHPELYGSVIALEPYDNPGSGGRAMLATEAEYDAHSPGQYLPTMTFTHAVPTFLDDGELARGGDNSETAGLAAQLRARGQDVLFREEPDLGHNWTLARTGIPYGLVFVSDHMPS